MSKTVRKYTIFTHAHADRAIRLYYGGISVAARRGWNGLAFQVGCTYIGTVVGAGFASGQEIYQFFGRYGNVGYLAIALAVALFAWLGYKIMYLGHRLQAYSYRELNTYLFGPSIGAVFDFVLIVMLFGVTVAMVAGAGELFKERLHLSFQVGAIVTLLLTYWTIVGGMKGILRANTIIVPCMVGCVLVSAVDVVWSTGFSKVVHVGTLLAPAHPFHGLVSGVVYAALNLGLAAGILIPLGASISSLSTLRTGAWMGAGGLGTMLVAVMFALYCHYPQFMQYAIPMGYIAAQIGPLLQWLFVFVLWGEIYSTLVSNVYAVGAQFGARTSRQMGIITAIICVAAYLGSQIGFSTIVTHVYSVFGWVSMLLVIAIVWPREKLSSLS